MTDVMERVIDHGVATPPRAKGAIAVIAVLGAAVLIFAASRYVPELLWQSGHGWPQLAMGNEIAGEQAILDGRLLFIPMSVILCGFLGTPIPPDPHHRYLLVGKRIGSTRPSPPAADLQPEPWFRLLRHTTRRCYRGPCGRRLRGGIAESVRARRADRQSRYPARISR